MSKRAGHALLGFAGALLALTARSAVLSLDDEALYEVSVAGACALVLSAWFLARRRAQAHPEPSSRHEPPAARLGRVIACLGAGAGAAWLALDAIAPPASPALAGPNLSAADLAALCDRGLPSLAFASPRPRVLLAGSGGGLELACALRHGARRIEVVEPSAALPAIVRRLPSADAARTIFRAANPRAFARAHARQYDLVLLPVAGGAAHTWPAGALPMREATLETDAGIAALLESLDEKGALFALIDGEPAALRFAATARAALQRLGDEHPERHFAVHQSGDSYGVLVKRARFVLDEVLDLHQQNRTRANSQPLPWFDALVRGAERAPELRFTPGAMFTNRFGELLAPSPRVGRALAQRYLFDLSAPQDARPLFAELTRRDLPESWSKRSAPIELPALALFALASALILTLAAGPTLATGVAARLGAVGAGAALGCAQALAYAWIQHELALWLVPSRAVALCAGGLALGAWVGCALSRTLVSRRRRPDASARASALAMIALFAFTFDPLLAHASARGDAVVMLLASIAVLVLGAALVLPSATALSRPAPERAASGAWFAYAHATGLAVALPLAGALVFFIGYQVLIGVVAGLLALLLLGSAARRSA